MPAPSGFNKDAGQDAVDRFDHRCDVDGRQFRVERQRQSLAREGFGHGECTFPETLHGIGGLQVHRDWIVHVRRDPGALKLRADRIAVRNPDRVDVASVIFANRRGPAEPFWQPGLIGGCRSAAALCSSRRDTAASRRARRPGAHPCGS